MMFSLKQYDVFPKKNMMFFLKQAVVFDKVTR